jgi:hypothetical protein
VVHLYGSWLHAWLLDGRRANLARRTRGATRAHGLHTWRCPRTRGLWHVVAVVTAVAARVRAGDGERPCSQSASWRLTRRGLSPLSAPRAMARGSSCTLWRGPSPRSEGSSRRGFSRSPLKDDSRRGFSRSPLREPSRGSRCKGGLW